MHDEFEDKYLFELIRKALLSGSKAMQRSTIEFLDNMASNLNKDDEALSIALEELNDGANHHLRRRVKAATTIVERQIQTLDNARQSGIERSLQAIARIVGLGEIEARVLGLLARVSLHGTVQEFMSQIDLGCPTRWIVWRRPTAPLLDISPNKLGIMLKRDGRLIRTGMVRRDYSGEICVTGRVLDALDTYPSSVKVVRQKLIGLPEVSALSWDYFSHLGKDADMVASLLAGALDTKRRGIHVLLYGPPGTGKTEFAKTLASRIGAAIYSVGEFDTDRDEPRRGERIAAWRLQQELLQIRGRQLILFDEMEDLFFGYGGSSSRDSEAAGSKAFIHRIFEQSTIPTIWTANNLESFDSSLLRRFVFALELRIPSERVRTSIWSRELAQAGIPAGENDAAALASEFVAPPALAAGAVQAATLAGGGLTTVRTAVSSIAKAMAGGVPPRKTGALGSQFDAKLANTNLNLGALTDKLTIPGAPLAFSFCLSGPPGTGKSEYARWLAYRLDLPVLHKRASDLLSMWVGGTERNIARAFDQARSEGGFLIFDEADSLLRSRKSARQSWEITQVNEMLTWMESHELPFACTTNLVEELDEATLRRFTFKIQMRFLNVDQSRIAFRHFFSLEAPVALDHLRRLTPGDFAVVARRASLLDCFQDPVSLVEMLREEEEVKPSAPRPIGFGASL